MFSKEEKQMLIELLRDARYYNGTLKHHASKTLSTIRNEELKEINQDVLRAQERIDMAEVFIKKLEF